MANPTATAAQAAAAFPFDVLIFGIVLILLAVVLWHFFKNLLANTVAGVVALLVISILADWAKYPAIKISITLVTVIISAILGLAGVGLLLLLKLLGIVIQ
jgi:hypothetical protein